jgi:hypothetical protein
VTTNCSFFLPNNLKYDNKNISIKSKVLLVLSTIALVTSIFVPLWRIELDAPQYPEGLMMQIHANKLVAKWILLMA